MLLQITTDVPFFFNCSHPDVFYIFKKIIYSRLITHITSKNNFTNSQFGFRKRPSTDKAAYKLINDILTALNDKIIVEGIFFDLEKAFDAYRKSVLPE
jgi:hypothetical protein